MLKTALLVATSASAAFGVGYALLIALPAVQTTVASGHGAVGATTALVAALGFAAAQARAVQLAHSDRPRFLAWLLPPAIYLVAIGGVGWLRRGETLGIWLDTFRGLLLCILGFLQFRRLGTSDTSKEQQRG